MRTTYLLLAVLVTALGLSATVRAADDNKGWADAEPLEELDFFFEFNATDEDLGVQLNLGADPWRQLQVLNADDKLILDVSGKGDLQTFGLSSLCFESNEPTFDELSKDEILALFPEGDYTFRAVTIEGDKLSSTVALTHDLPDEPEITCPEDGDVVDPDDVVVKWNAVSTPAGIDIVSYQVIVTNDEDSRFRYDVVLPADATSLSVPAEFFEDDTEYELEVIAKEASGNQTIGLIFFTTEED